MSKELSRIAEEIDTKGYVLTTYDKLSLPFDKVLVESLCAAAAGGSFSPDAAELTKHIEKSNMAIVQDERALALGRQLVRPVVDLIFADSQRARNNWNLYSMNYYDGPGASLGSHQDSVGATVLVVTASGARDFKVYEQPEYEGQQTTVKEVIRVEPGSVMILDAYADPLHSVDCIEGPSVSAVLDVPDMLRP